MTRGLHITQLGCLFEKKYCRPNINKESWNFPPSCTYFKPFLISKLLFLNISNNVIIHHSHSWYLNGVFMLQK